MGHVTRRAYDGMMELLVNRKNQKVIYIVGMGPGAPEMMTGQARDVLEKSDVIVGYTVYTELLQKTFPDKEYASTPMRQEIERCRMCYELADSGKTVALVCSGDAGVYGMAGPMYELSGEHPKTELVVVPGITAANSGAAVLGAPLGNDYCVISLSDLLTPWEKIEKRLTAAIEADLVIVLYNPSSKKRKDYLERACEIMRNAGAPPALACGYVENIGREGTKAVTCTLAELKYARVNMFTTVFIGNSATVIIDGKLVAVRGYDIR